MFVLTRVVNALELEEHVCQPNFHNRREETNEIILCVMKLKLCSSYIRNITTAGVAIFILLNHLCLLCVMTHINVVSFHMSVSIYIFGFILQGNINPS